MKAMGFAVEALVFEHTYIHIYNMGSSSLLVLVRGNQRSKLK